MTPYELGYIFALNNHVKLAAWGVPGQMPFEAMGSAPAGKFKFNTGGGFMNTMGSMFGGAARGAGRAAGAPGRGRGNFMRGFRGQTDEIPHIPIAPPRKPGTQIFGPKAQEFMDKHLGGWLSPGTMTRMKTVTGQGLGNKAVDFLANYGPAGVAAYGAMRGLGGGGGSGKPMLSRGMKMGLGALGVALPAMYFGGKLLSGMGAAQQPSMPYGQQY